MRGDRAALAEAVFRHRWDAARLHAAVPGAVVHEVPGRILQVVTPWPIRFMNVTTSGRLRPREADRTIAEATGRLRDRGLPGIWWVGPDPHAADVADRLAAAGWVRLEPMPWMARDLAEPLDRAALPGVEIRRVASPGDQAAWLEAMRLGFGLDPAVADGLARLADAVGTDGPWLRYVALVDGVPAASAGIHLTGGVAGLYNVATRPDLRRRGIGTAVTVAALADARAGGASLAVLGTTPAGRRTYERLGFVDACVVELLGLGG